MIVIAKAGPTKMPNGMIIPRSCTTMPIPISTVNTMQRMSTAIREESQADGTYSVTGFPFGKATALAGTGASTA
jgi:hypothetical protein